MRPGELLNERYQIRQVLGEGVMGVTCLADDRSTGRPCIVKGLSFRKLETWKALELFEREVKVLTHLDHPRIPKLVDAFREEGEEGLQLYSVREYAEGQDLLRLVESGRHFTEKEIVRIGLEVAEVLEYLHAFTPAILHRDLKPSNVLLDVAGEAHVIDFGAVSTARPQEHARSSTIVGTFGYMPIEQISGRPVPASDIYSLGATLIFLLSRRDPAEMAVDGVRLNFRPHVKASAALVRVLSRMVHPDPRRRQASASDLRGAFERLARGAPDRGPALRLFTAAAAVGLALGFLANLWLRRERISPPPIEAVPSGVSWAPVPPTLPVIPVSLTAQPVGSVEPLTMISALRTIRSPGQVAAVQDVARQIAAKEGTYSEPASYLQMPAVAKRAPNVKEELDLSFSISREQMILVEDREAFLEIEAACGSGGSLLVEVANPFGEWERVGELKGRGNWRELRQLFALGRPLADNVAVRMTSWLAPETTKIDSVRAYLARSSIQKGPMTSSTSASRALTPVPLTLARFVEPPPGQPATGSEMLVRKLIKKDGYADPAGYVEFPFERSGPSRAELELGFAIPAAASSTSDFYVEVTLACRGFHSMRFRVSNRFGAWDELGVVRCEGRTTSSQESFRVGRPSSPLVVVRVTGAGRLDAVQGRLQ